MRPLDHVEPVDLLRRALKRAGFDDAGWQVALLQGDGSERRFYRLRGRSEQLIALVSPRRPAAAVDENDSYAAIGGLLQQLGLPVPRFYLAAPESGCFIMEDVGDHHFQTFVARLGSRSRVEAAYRAVLKLMVGMHRRVPSRFSSDYCFDGATYTPEFVLARELEYFRTAFVNQYLGLSVTLADLQPDYDRIADQAGRRSTRQVLHRDFQSRNLMVHRGRLRLLDFQGMRWGPSVYDLAAVLLDPYAALPESLRERLVEVYWSGASGFLNCHRRRFMRDYEVVRLCRNLQVLGAFAFLSTAKGKPFFRAFIPGAWRQLRIWIDRPFGAAFPRLRECVREIDQERHFSTPSGA